MNLTPMEAKPVNEQVIRKQSANRRQSGNVTLMVAVAMVGLLSFAAYAIDGGYIYGTRAQLQNAADASALAAIDAIRDGLSHGEAVAAAKGVADLHKTGNQNLDLGAATGDVLVGSYDFASKQFYSGSMGPGVPAVQVQTRRDDSSSQGGLDLLLGQLLGIDKVNMNAKAIAAVRRRDIVIVQDRTNSFKEEFEEALIADEALVDAMGGPQALVGDRVGLVSFSRISAEELELTALAEGGSTTVVDAIQGMEVCQNASASTGCNGTGTAAGIDEAVDLFERDSTGGDAERVMVVVTDGSPCYTEDGNPTARAKADAIDAADRAADAGISLFVITLAVPVSPGAHICLQGDEEFNNNLARGFGFGLSTPEPDELDNLLVSILKQMPLRLVD